MLARIVVVVMVVAVAVACEEAINLRNWSLCFACLTLYTVFRDTLYILSYVAP